MKLYALSGLLLLACTTVAAQNKPNEIVGIWRLTIKADPPAPGQAPSDNASPRFAKLKLDVVQGQLTGAWASSRAAYAVTSLVYADRQISFSFELDPGDGHPVPMSFKGAIQDDHLAGRLTTPLSVQSITGERVVQSPAAPEATPPAGR